MQIKDKDTWCKIVGWTLSLGCILAGASFLWPHVHVALLGMVFIYIGVRIFNFSTFDEYKQKRMELLLKWFK